MLEQSAFGMSVYARYMSANFAPGSYLLNNALFKIAIDQLNQIIPQLFLRVFKNLFKIFLSASLVQLGETVVCKTTCLQIRKF